MLRTGRTRAALALGTMAAGVWTALPVSPVHADSTFDGFARANGFDVIINNQSIPTGIDVQGVGPEAEAHQTSYGVGDASAQIPYTGGTVPGLAGTAGGLFGVPVPPYPFIASSTQGGDPQTVSYPGVLLHAESREVTTLANAVAGSDSSGSTSTARVDSSKDGSVTASAVTDASGLKLGGVATLSAVATEATVTADGESGELTRTTHTSIGRISVPGLVLTIPSQTPSQVGVPVPIPGIPNPPPVPLPVFQVPAGGTIIKNPDIGIQDGFFTLTVPVGPGSQRVAIPSGPVLDALKAAGIAMTFQAPEKLKTGVISGTYKFVYSVPAPPDNRFYTGPTKITQTTGLATATVDLSPAAVDLGGGFDGTGSTGGLSGPAVGFTPGTGTADGSGLAPSGDLGAGIAGVPSVGSGPSVAGADDPVASSAPRLPIAGFSVGLGIGNLYLALVVIALLGFVSATAMRLMGVRFLWTS